MSVCQHDGLWWPEADRQARAIILRDCEPDMAALLQHVPERRVIVQAGGNVGTYALALADRFSQVITFEPDPVNWACLERNLAARDSLRRVTAHRAALGEVAGVCDPTTVEPSNCGAHRVEFNIGDVPVMTIDSLNLRHCDCIWLDLEGSEVFALRGATETIKRCAPTISVEDKGLGARFFGVAGTELGRFMTEHGYQQVGAYGRDKVFRRM